METRRFLVLVLFAASLGCEDQKEPPKPPPVAAVTVSLETTRVTVRSIVAASATAQDASGAAVARPISWRTSDATIAEVDGTGSVIALAAGTVQIIASSEGKDGSAMLQIDPGALPIRGLYTQFERRGFPNGYWSGDAIREFELQDQFVPSLGLVKEEIGRQMDTLRSLGVNTITFELRTADATFISGPRTPPECNVSPATGLLYPQPPESDLVNLRSFFDLAQSKGLKILLRLVNNHMDVAYRADSTTWLDAILNRVKDHPALELVLFEGDVRLVDLDNNGSKESCGGLAEPPLYLGPDKPVAKYVEWAIGHAQLLGVANARLSAQASIGNFIVDTESNAGANAQDQHLWHAMGVMKTIFDRVGIPDEERTYAASFYYVNKCAQAGSAACTDAPPDAWAEETIARAFTQIGKRSRARIVAVEYGLTSPMPSGWNTSRQLQSQLPLMRKYGVAGGSFWRWTNFEDAEDANPATPDPLKRRGTSASYTASKDVLMQLYNEP